MSSLWLERCSERVQVMWNVGSKGHAGAWAASCALFLTGCGSEPEATLPDSGHVWMREFAPDAGTAITWIVVVDDRDDEQGRLFRGRVKQGFSTYIRDLLANRTRDGHDPDQWFAVDLRMVVVHPSSAGWIGPDEDPALRWTTTAANEVGALAFADAFARAVDRDLASAGASYPLLEAYRRVGRLVTRCDPPRDGSEARLVEATGVAPWIRLVVATTRDDASPEPPDAYRLDARSLCEGTDRGETSVFVPEVPTAQEGWCTPTVAPSWRLAAWNETVLIGTPTRCSDAATPGDAFDRRLIVDVRPTCLSRPIAVGSDGLASCSLEVLHQEGGCSAARGWFDPPEGPATANVGDPASPFRLCEVRQLEGAAGALCRSGADCTDCPSGFCRVDEARPICREGTFPTQLRFIGGVFSGRRVRGHIRCLLE